ncbi:hypothetical protein GCM10020000_27820 [Streptomyces olivoverticillatus]
MRQLPLISRRVAAAAVSVVLLGGAAACGPKQGGDAQGGGGAPKKGGTLTVLNRAPQKQFDPARLYTSGGGNIPSLVYRTLTTRHRANGAEGTKVVPDLATSTGTPPATTPRSGRTSSRTG